VTLLCRIVGRRDMARSVASALVESDRGASVEADLHQVSAAVLSRLQRDLRDLAARRPDLMEKLDLLLEDGLLAMKLRWPETEAAVAMLRSRRQKRAGAGLGIEEKSVRIVAAAPTDLRQQYLLAAVPEAAAA
jgi:hypothetical protein